MAFLQETDVAAGEKIFTTKCLTCHTNDKGGAAKQGPNLWGIINAAKGSKGDFAYSDALKEMGGKWGYQELSEFLTKPKKYLPGTRMAFAGIKKPQDRGNLLAYLRTLSGSPVPIPAYTPPPPEEEVPEDANAAEKQAETEDLPAELPKKK